MNEIFGRRVPRLKVSRGANEILLRRQMSPNFQHCGHVSRAESPFVATKQKIFNATWRVFKEWPVRKSVFEGVARVLKEWPAPKPEILLGSRPTRQNSSGSDLLAYLVDGAVS